MFCLSSYVYSCPRIIFIPILTPSSLALPPGLQPGHVQLHPGHLGHLGHVQLHPVDLVGLQEV